MTAVLLSLAAFVSTISGGLLALKFRDRLHFLLSFTAGVLLGVVSFDVLPEIFELAERLQLGVMRAMVALVAGFLFFHAAEKFVLLHHAHESGYADHRHPHVGVVSALALIGHSILDGVGIGLAFQASTAVGISVAIAVIAHDFSDGLNTVGLMLAHRNTTRRDARPRCACACAWCRIDIAVPSASLMAHYLSGFLCGVLAIHRRCRYLARSAFQG